VLTDVKSFKSSKENGKLQRLAQERWVVYLFYGLVAVIAFQVFIEHSAVIARRIP
jgi:hypothetical protein